MQAHLAEYNALRKEILVLIKWRDSLVFVSLAISGALLSFELGPQAPKTSTLALYLIAPFASLIGWLWIVNTWRLLRISLYIKDVLAVHINALLEPAMANHPVMNWEGSSNRLQFKWERPVLESAIYLAIFVGSGIVGQVLLLPPGRALLQRSTVLAYPIAYWSNWLLIASIFVLLLNYLLGGRRLRNQAVLVRR